jgi:hypothetical protein
MQPGLFANDLMSELQGGLLLKLRDTIYDRNKVNLPRSPDERRKDLLCSESFLDHGVLLLQILATRKIGKSVSSVISSKLRTGLGSSSFLLLMDFSAGTVTSVAKVVYRALLDGIAIRVRFSVTTIRWEEVPDVMQQLKLLASTDVLLTNPGSGAFNVIFMRSGTSLVTAPFCSTIERKSCSYYEIDVSLEHLVSIIGYCHMCLHLFDYSCFHRSLPWNRSYTLQI